jgi:hypothetical protein
MATNAFKNQTRILGLFVRNFKNEMVLSKMVDRQVSEKEFGGSTNTNSGSTVYVKRPVRATSTSGASITEGQLTSIEQATVPVTVDQRRKVSFTITQDEMALNDIGLSEFLKPFARELVQDVENYLASLYYAIPNAIGTPGSSPQSFLEVGAARSRLFAMGVPVDGLFGCYTPQSALYIADAIKASPNEGLAKMAIEEAFIKKIAGTSLYECQSLKRHTVGVATGTPLVNGASQNVTYATAKDTNTQTLLTDGWTASQTGIMKKGDTFTIDGVYEINQNTRTALSNLQRFTVMADADSDNVGNNEATLTISPPIITSGPYQTVSAAPADDAEITVLGTGGESYAQNMTIHKNCMTLAFAKLPELDAGTGVMSKRYSEDGISMNYSVGSDISNLSSIYRFDILFGAKVQNPLFGMRTYGE